MTDKEYAEYYSRQINKMLQLLLDFCPTGKRRSVYLGRLDKLIDRAYWMGRHEEKAQGGKQWT